MQGKILASRYQIICYIGKGGFGKTYLAEDIDLPNHNRCVVKQLYPQINDPNFLQMARRLFQKEGETLNKLHHPQIPRLVAYFEEEKQFYLVQEYIEGHTLSQELKPGSIWSENAVIELLKDCLNILNYIHNNGVIHRDVKPDNLIRRSSDRKLVLVDFGTVKEFVITESQFIRSTVAVGTKGYMPTEQAIGKPRPSSDLYALGIIGIQALTGVHPLQLPDDEYGELRWQPQAKVSRQLAAILTKMVRYHFGDRYHSAKEVLTALDAIEGYPAANVPTVSAKSTPTGSVNDSPLSQVIPTSEQPTNLMSSTPTKSNLNSSSNSAVPRQNLSSLPPTTNLPASPASLTLNSPPVSNFERERAIHNSSREIPVANFHARGKIHAPQSNHKSLIALASALALGGATVGAMYLFNKNNAQIEQQSIQQQVEQLNSLISSNQYQQCYERVTKIDPNQTTTLPEAERLQFQAQCGLGRAKEQAQSLNYQEALAIAAELPRGTSFEAEIEQLTNQWSQQLFKEAEAMSQQKGKLKAEIEQLTSQWSQQLFKEAEAIYQQEGKLQEALELVERIPESSPVKSQAQTESDRWKSEYDTNKNIIANAREALKEKNWQKAKQEATKVKNSTSSYWREQARAIISQAEEALEAENVQTPVTPPKIEPPTNPTEKEPSKDIPNHEKPAHPTNPEKLKPSNGDSSANDPKGLDNTHKSGELRDLDEDSSSTGSKELDNTPNSGELPDLDGNSSSASDEPPIVTDPPITNPQSQDDSLRDL